MNSKAEAAQDIRITADGGVSKTVLSAGEGNALPPEGCKVEVHYTGRLTNGTIFDSSVLRKKPPFTFVLGAGQVITGWDKAVATMRKGEKAEVCIAPNYAYGKSGVGSIPGGATLLFEIELLDWHLDQEVMEPERMPPADEAPSQQRVESKEIQIILQKFAAHGILARNSAGFIKELLLRGDVRLLHFVKRCRSENKDTLVQLYEHFQELIENESSKVFNAVYKDLTLQQAKVLSRNERNTNKELEKTTSLTYGEIDYSSFYKILRRLGPCKGKKFIDLGSGTARALVAARLILDFKSCKGIEILNSLHHAAEGAVQTFSSLKKSMLACHTKSDVNVYEGSITAAEGDLNWSDGDIVFANSTCFSASLMNEISDLGEQLAPGAIFITFTKPLQSTKFELLDKSRLKMSWGPATVYVQRRLGRDGKPLGPSPLDSWKQSELMAEALARPLLELTTLSSSAVHSGELHRCIYNVREPRKPKTNTSKRDACTTTEVKYLLRAPADYDASTSLNLPLVVFLHGASARGNTFESHEQMALPAAVGNLEAQGTIPSGSKFVLLAPLCPFSTEWQTEHMSYAILQLIDEICKVMHVDRSRVYLTGVSMGGLGSWMLAARAAPRAFAAISPMCGGGLPVYARLLKDLPVWFFHSAEDNVIGVEETEALYQALLKEGSTVAKFTRYSSCPDPAAQPWMVGHNCWSRTYKMKEFWNWLLAHRAPSA